MMPDDPKKTDAPVPGSPVETSGTPSRSGTGAETAFNEMLRKRKMRHIENDPPESGDLQEGPPGTS